MFTTTAFAANGEDKPTSAKEVQELIIAAESGDVSASQKILSMDAFDKDKVDKLLKGVKVSSEDGPKEFKFSDGSSVCITVGSIDSTDSD